MRIIDISKFQGAIDWTRVSQIEDMAGAILRSTTKNGQLDVGFIENMNGVISNMNSHFNHISFYKLSYATDYASARIEAFKTIYKLQEFVPSHVRIRLWLDLEPDGIGRQHTKFEAEQLITAYADACRECGIDYGLYVNRTYALYVVSSEYLKSYPVWLARYNSIMGDDYSFRPVLWQYTSKGRIDGINGNVDISEVLR